MNSQQKLLWAAGFLDGEGCVFIGVSHGTSYWLQLNATQTDPAPLHVLKELFGGTVSRRSQGGFGRRPMWQWAVRSRQAAVALRRLEPFLIVKKGEANLALQFQATTKSPPGRQHPEIELAERASYRLALMDVHRGEISERRYLDGS